MLPLQVNGCSATSMPPLPTSVILRLFDEAAGVSLVVPIEPPAFNVIPVPAAPRLASLVKRRTPPLTVVPPA